MNRYIKAQMLSPDRTRREDARPDARFRDRDGREHYDDGRFAPMSYGGMWADGRSGRYIPPRGNYDRSEMEYPMPSYVPPVYERAPRYPYDALPSMHKIGFAVEGEMERIPAELGQEYRTMAGYAPMDEMTRRSGSGYQTGRGRAAAYPAFDQDMAEEWTAHMENEDGTVGPHWPLDKIKQELNQRGIKCDPVKFWAVINSIYSDDVAVAKKHSVNTMDYYIDRAKAWLDDKDAVTDKAAAYYQYVVRH